MFEFAFLILICVFYIYVIEYGARRAIRNQPSPFDEVWFRALDPIVKFLGYKPLWSNIILVVGVIIALGIFFASMSYYPKGISGVFIGLAVFIQFMAITLSACFSGETWISKIRNWLDVLNRKLGMQIFKRVIFEIILLIFFMVPFAFMIFIALLYFAERSESVVRLYLVFYFFPIVSTLWIYRLGDKDEFQLNTRRLLMYLIVAILLFVSKNPLLQLAKISIEPSDEITLLGLLQDFSVLAFIAFDRVAKVIFELIRQAKGLKEPADIT